MASISSLGVGSNLDLEGILSSLISVERAPLARLISKEANFQADISGLGSLKSALASLQSSANSLAPAIGQTATAKLATFKASIADTSVASITASSSAVAGNYSLEVTQLAVEERQALGPVYGAAEPVINFDGNATRTLTLTKGSGESVNVTLDSSKNTLADLRDALNKANAGVSAVIVTDANNKQNLLITATGTGEDNAITLSGDARFIDPGGGADIDAGSAFTISQEAKNAEAKINGVAVSASSNTLTSAVDGLSITLLKTNTGSQTTMAVTRDSSSIVGSLNSFISKYNELNSTMKSLGSYDPTTKVAGALNGDSALRAVENQIRNTINTVPAGLSGASYQRLGEIGISMDKNGALSLDNVKFQKALGENFEAVANVIGEYGKSFQTVTSNLLATNGVIATRTEGLNRSIADLRKQSDALELRVAAIEKQYRAQFTALDTTVASMQSTSSYLSQQLEGLSAMLKNK